VLRAGSQTRGPRGRFVRPAMPLGSFQIINIYVAKCLAKRRREIIESNLNDIQCGFRPGVKRNFWLHAICECTE